MVGIQKHFEEEMTQTDEGFSVYENVDLLNGTAFVMRAYAFKFRSQRDELLSALQTQLNTSNVLLVENQHLRTEVENFLKNGSLAAWTYVNDGLPPADGRYLVTLLDSNAKGGRRVTTRYFRGKGYDGVPNRNRPLYNVPEPHWQKVNSGRCWERRTLGVVAWAPLPEGYFGLSRRDREKSRVYSIRRKMNNA